MKTFLFYLGLIVLGAVIVAIVSTGLQVIWSAIGLSPWLLVAVLVLGYAGFLTWAHNR